MCNCRNDISANVIALNIKRLYCYTTLNSTNGLKAIGCQDFCVPFKTEKFTKLTHNDNLENKVNTFFYNG